MVDSSADVVIDLFPRVPSGDFALITDPPFPTSEVLDSFALLIFSFTSISAAAAEIVVLSKVCVKVVCCSPLSSTLGSRFSGVLSVSALFLLPFPCCCSCPLFLGGRWHSAADVVVVVVVVIVDDRSGNESSVVDFTFPLGVRGGATDSTGSTADGIGEDDLGDDPPPLNKFAIFSLDVSSSIASIVDRPEVCAFRNAVETVMTLVASSKLIPIVSIVLNICYYPARMKRLEILV